MSDQDWKNVKWTVTTQDNMGISVNDELSFGGQGSTWSITTQSSSWDGVYCYYDQTSDTVSGSTKNGTPFTIVRSVVAPPGKDSIRCETPRSGGFTEAFTGQGQFKAASVKPSRAIIKNGGGSAGPDPGGSWTAEEGSGVYQP